MMSGDPERRCDLAFERDYEVEFAGETSGYESSYVYDPGASRSGGRDGAIVRVRPRLAPPWLGVFARGYRWDRSDPRYPPPGSAVRAGRFVSSSDPQSWYEVDFVGGRSSA